MKGEYLDVLDKTPGGQGGSQDNNKKNKDILLLFLIRCEQVCLYVAQELLKSGRFYEDEAAGVQIEQQNRRTVTRIDAYL